MNVRIGTYALIDGPYLRYLKSVAARLGDGEWDTYWGMPDREADDFLRSRGIPSYEDSAECARARLAQERGEPPEITVLWDTVRYEQRVEPAVTADEWALRNDSECSAAGPTDAALADGVDDP